MSPHTLTSDTQIQQQQMTDDFGQQQQEELGWNADLKASDGGQQQVQLEELDAGYAARAHNGSYYSSSISSYGRLQSGRHNQQQQEIDDFGQQQVQVEDLEGTFTTRQHAGSSQKHVVALDTTAKVEVNAEQENSGIWSKLKKKTNNLFG